MFTILFILSAISVKSVYTTTAEEKKKIVDLHNNEREIVKPTAANMELMAYSNEMEALAAEWATKCVFKHPDRDVHRKYRGTGQNLAMFGGSKPADLYGRSLSTWNNEKVHYSYSTHRCAGSCGHYTQVVWASTNAVGCAWKSCPGIMRGYKEGYLVVCQYKPPGNMNGQKPYVGGPSCSQCAKADFCLKNQCSKHKSSSWRNNVAISSFSIYIFAYILV